MPIPVSFDERTSTCSQDNHLVEFRAGKRLLFRKTVFPDHREGLIFMYKIDGSVMHFCWKDQNTGIVEDDLVVIPGEAEFIKVQECTTERIFVLKFKSPSRMYFYWMQEPEMDKDDEYCRIVNKYLNDPPESNDYELSQSDSQQIQMFNLSDMAKEQSGEFLNHLDSTDFSFHTNGDSQSNESVTKLRTPSSVLASSSANDNNQSNSSVNNENQSNDSITESSTSGTPETTTLLPATSSSSSSACISSIPESSNQSQLCDLEAITLPEKSFFHTPIEPSSGLTPEVLRPLFDNRKLVDNLKILYSSTPESVIVIETLGPIIQSPEFQEALCMCRAALQSGELTSLMEQVGFRQEIIDAVNSGDIGTFMEALEKLKRIKRKNDDIESNRLNKRNKINDEEEVNI